METPCPTVPPPPPETPAGLPAVTALCQAALILALTGLSIGGALCLWLFFPADTTAFWDNQLNPAQRRGLFGWMMGGAGAAMVLAALYGAVTRRRGELLARIGQHARLFSPLATLGFFAFAFRWRLWQNHNLVFCLFVALFALVAYATIEASQAAGLGQTRPWLALGRSLSRLAARWPRLVKYLPLGLVLAAAAAYVAFFAYNTIRFHQGVWTGFDTGIKNNIFWNTLHGAPFKATPTMGPDGPSHFGLHSDLLVYLLLPFYWLHQDSSTILFFQSLFPGAAAVALFYVMTLYTRPAIAALLALSYLFHPALAGANLFEFHFILFGLPLLWASWACVERRHFVAGIIFGVLTLMTREDVSFWMVILGAYWILSGKHVRAGIVSTTVGMAFFVTIKFFIMPHYSGGQSFTFIYEGLMTSEDNGLGGALKTALINPPHLLSTLLREDKLVYLLQIFLPVAFLPWRRRLFLLLAVPGFLLTILPPHYLAVFNISFQYGPHWLAFLYPATALVLGGANGEARRLAPRIAAIACASLAMSYQYGAILQQNTSWSGPRQFRFGFSDESRARRDAMHRLLKEIPPDARVAGSSVAAPQLTNRTYAYDMNVGWFDAEYLVAPTEQRDFISHEREHVLERLNDGSWGVVRIEPPFFLMKKGHATTLNGELLGRIR